MSLDLHCVTACGGTTERDRASEVTAWECFEGGDGATIEPHENAPGLYKRADGECEPKRARFPGDKKRERSALLLEPAGAS